MPRLASRFLLLLAALPAAVRADAGMEWPQFRGPGGTGVSSSASPPASFRPDRTTRWRTPLPPGNSSPIVSGERIFVTAVREARLETLCFDLRDGSLVWRREIAPNLVPAPAGGSARAWGLRNPDDHGRPATPTPVTDGRRLFVYFGAFGIVAYDLSGTELWRRPLTPPDPEATASPICVGDRLILVCDREGDSFIEALDPADGHRLWRTERAGFMRSRSTPFHRSAAGRGEIVVNGSWWLTGYDAASGLENWRLPGMARIGTGSPAAAGDLVFVAGSAAGDDYNPDAFPGKPVESVFGTSLDLPGLPGNPSESIPRPGEGVFAIRLKAGDTAPEPALAWKSTRGVPYAASPLVYRERLYTVKSGGFVSAYDPGTGRVLFQNERLAGSGDQYASPVAADGRIYLVSQSGRIVVLDAAPVPPTVLDESDLEEPVLATPALAGGSLVVRTARALHGFTVRP